MNVYPYSILTIAIHVMLAACQILTQPEQIHISYGDSPGCMLITWTTQNWTSSVVQYGLDTLNDVAHGNSVEFTDGGPLRRSMWIHRVTLHGLLPGKAYRYNVGSVKGWSEKFTFTAMRSGPEWSPVFAVFGDMGNKNAVALPSLQMEAQKGTIDVVLHVGDFAYNLDTDNAKVGDAFMNQIQPIAAYVPYMVCPGNHEHKYNFSNYKNRFTMPGQDAQNLFYSFDIGPAHIIAFSTEVYYYPLYNIYDWNPLKKQYQWLEKDLQEANKPENRAIRPWIITLGHRPMYCSSGDRKMCEHVDINKVRIGIPHRQFPGLEDLFYKHGVDVQIYAHEHNYERLWPVYNKTVCNGTGSPYANPRAPVHIITGSAGNPEGQGHFVQPVHPWSAFQTNDFGYTRMTIINDTHMTFDQLSVKHAENAKIIDSITVMKDDHGLGHYDCHTG